MICRSFPTCLCPKLHLLLCLLPTAAFASQTGGKTDESRSYNFDLSVGGAYEVRATTGETITVTLVLKRTDAQESADMYGMQMEIEYDDTFLQLVDGSVMTAPGIRWSDLGRRTGGRAFYLNFVSFKGGSRKLSDEGHRHEGCVAAYPHQHPGFHPGRHGRIHREG